MVHAPNHPVTPDGRYFVVRGRLWRRSNSALSAATRASLIRDLSRARSALRRNSDASDRKEARQAVDRAKVALGERGPVWWEDGAPDFNRRMAVNTPYRGWYEGLQHPEILPMRKPNKRDFPVAEIRTRLGRHATARPLSSFNRSLRPSHGGADEPSA
jgi:hypothetical protein